RDERRTDEVHADPVDDLRRACRRHLLLEDVALDDRRAAAAVRARPMDADPAGRRERPLPGAQECDLVRERRMLAGIGRLVRREQGAQLGAKRFRGGREPEIQGGAVLACVATTVKRSGPPPRMDGGPAGRSRRTERYLIWHLTVLPPETSAQLPSAKAVSP